VPVFFRKNRGDTSVAVLRDTHPSDSTNPVKEICAIRLALANKRNINLPKLLAKHVNGFQVIDASAICRVITQNDKTGHALHFRTAGQPRTASERY